MRDRFTSMDVENGLETMVGNAPHVNARCSNRWIDGSSDGRTHRRTDRWMHIAFDTRAVGKNFEPQSSDFLRFTRDPVYVMIVLNIKITGCHFIRKGKKKNILNN